MKNKQTSNEFKLRHCLINSTPNPYPQTLTVFFDKDCYVEEIMEFTVNPKTEQEVRQHITKRYKKEVIEKIVLEGVVDRKLKTPHKDIIECAAKVYWLVFFKSGFVVNFIEYPWSFTKVPEGYHCRLTNEFHAFSKNRWYRCNSDKVVEKYKQWIGDVVQIAA
jgi:hypothetical protein